MKIIVVTVALYLALSGFPAFAQTTELDGDHAVDGFLCAGKGCNSGVNFFNYDLVIRSSTVDQNGIYFDDTHITPGFSMRDWAIHSNELFEDLFSVHDVEAGFNVLSIEPDAREYALYLSTGGNVGLGTDTPEGTLHLVSDEGNTDLVFQSNAAKWIIRNNAYTGRITFRNDTTGLTPFKFGANATENLFRVGVLSENTVDINGDLVVAGNCTEMNGACADYVFEPGYELRPLDALGEFIKSNRHLPNIPSAREMQDKGVNMANITGRLLEKIEELTLYTLDQQESIDSVTALVEAQSVVIEQQAVQLNALQQVIQ